jgi:hypothetical protein
MKHVELLTFRLYITGKRIVGSLSDSAPIVASLGLQSI